MFTGKRILVVGMARSGIAAINALLRRGAVIKAYDAKSEIELGEQLDKLKQMGVSIYAGIYPPLSKDEVDLVVISPGVALDIVPIQQAIQLEIPIIGELELAYLMKSEQVEIYAVTGTNGKTTTTSLLQHIMQMDGRNSASGGNIGVALCSLVDIIHEGVMVVEVSSFQLETSHSFRPHVCGIINITPDHLDRHKSMENYIYTKSKIFVRQTGEDFTVLNYEDENIRDFSSLVKSQLVFFSVERELDSGVFIKNNSIFISAFGQKSEIASLSDIRLRGKHNLENVLCAVAMAWVGGVGARTIRQSLNTFEGVRHRLEEVAHHNGVLYINDSKGTNPDSTIKALEAFDSPIVLIAGGRPKGGSYASLVPLINKKVKELILLGEAKELIRQEVIESGFRNIHEVDDFKSAVLTANQLAVSGDVVLLSPACASWDMFPSYEHRGDLFCQIVKSLIQDE